MTRDAGNQLALPPWLVDWMRDASCHAQRHSLSLASNGNTDLEAVARGVADYLNEFDSEGGCQWRAFDTQLLRELAANPSSRDLVLSGSTPLNQGSPPRPDLDRVIRRLVRLGGVILTGAVGHEATADLSETFHICLSSSAPADHRRCHMWVNPDRFTVRGLVCIIADSFLNWSSHRAPLTKVPSETTSPLEDRGA